MASLDEFESRLQSLLEVHLLKYLPGYKVEDGIAQKLAAAMHANLKEEKGEIEAPNIYVIVGHPSTLTRWHAKPRLLKELANALYAAGKQAGFQFSTSPTITITGDTTMPADELRILASFSLESVGETLGIDSVTKPESNAGKIPGNAFLIVDGTQVVPLNRSVINIGRRLDNHIVLDDPRVSRSHAQLRIIREHFVLFDLNSSGGTFVNSERADQSVLYPGDVISLAGVTLIFGQDLPTGRVPSKGQTVPGLPISGERTTAILEKVKDNKK
jgi:hypothetical protein